MRVALLLGVVSLAAALDLATKAWAQASLESHRPLALLGEGARLILGYNRGVAFGLLDGTGPLPTILSGLVIAGLLGWTLQRALQARTPTVMVALLGLVIGGALGNFLDRLPDGRVTDFLDVGLGVWRWPTFNLADSFILSGFVLLVLLPTSSGSRQAGTTVQDQTPTEVNGEPYDDRH